MDDLRDGVVLALIFTDTFPAVVGREQVLSRALTLTLILTLPPSLPPSLRTSLFLPLFLFTGAFPAVVGSRCA